MEIDWQYVKQKTLWDYEALIIKLNKILSYTFVREHYNHSMAEAGDYARKIRAGYLQNSRDAAFIEELSGNFKALGNLGIQDYHHLIQRVKSRADCVAFLQGTGFGFEALIDALDYLLRWVLPFEIPVRELLDSINDIQPDYPQILKNHKIRSNLDVLEIFRSKAGRITFSVKTAMEESFIQELVHRADISRLAYMRGKTIKHLCGGGYDTLDKIASADLNKMEADMAAYYNSIGKRLADFKLVIPLKWMVGGAGVLPRVVEY